MITESLYKLYYICLYDTSHIRYTLLIFAELIAIATMNRLWMAAALTVTAYLSRVLDWLRAVLRNKKGIR